MEYLITPPESTNWKIDQNQFMNQLTQAALEIDLNSVANPEDYHIIEGKIKFPNTQKLAIALHRDLQGISLDGLIEDCAKFAIWFRSVVPLSQALVFYDQGYNHHLNLLEKTKEGDILQTFVEFIKS
jgi:hypothetical protein